MFSIFLKVLVVLLSFTSISLANCSFDQTFGNSIDTFKAKFGTSLIVVPGEWGLEEVMLEKNSLCTNNDFEDLFSTYSFLSDKLVEIKIVSIEKETLNLIDWTKDKYGEATDQVSKDLTSKQNNFFWELDDRIIFAEYTKAPYEIFQVVKIISKSYDDLFDAYYENVEKGSDPTFQEKMYNFRLSISDKYDN